MLKVKAPIAIGERLKVKACNERFDKFTVILAELLRLSEMGFLFYISLCVVIIALIRFLISLYNYLYYPFVPEGKVAGNPLVSVLITSCDEIITANVLETITKQDYKNIEILIPTKNDDEKKYENKWNNLIINTLPICNKQQENDLPDKNQLIQQLAHKALGDFFIIFDENIIISPSLLSKAVAYMQHKKLSLLNLVPTKILNTIKSYIGWLGLSYIPFNVITKTDKLFRGTFNYNLQVINANDFRQFQLVSDENYNIPIFQKLKENRKRVKTLLGGCEIMVNRTQKSLASNKSYSKMLTFYLFISTLFPFIVIFGSPFPLALLYFFCLVSSRMLIAKVMGQSPYLSLLLLPIHHFILIYRATKGFNNL